MHALGEDLLPERARSKQKESGGSTRGEATTNPNNYNNLLTVIDSVEAKKSQKKIRKIFLKD